MAEATASELRDPNAIALATVDADGLPDVRMVLLKGVDRRGFVFYTNVGKRQGAGTCRQSPGRVRALLEVAQSADPGSRRGRRRVATPRPTLISRAAIR